MKDILARRLQKNDEVRVIAPSRSFAIIGEDTRKIASQRLEEIGLQVSFSKHSEEIDDFSSSSIQSRVEDIHTAFRGSEVKAVLTAIGGFNSNQLLDKLDWDLIRDNPKIFCGFSDITALSNAIYAKTGLITYSGPHFSSFGMIKGIEYTLKSFIAATMHSKDIHVLPSEEWSDDMWFLDQNKRVFVQNEGWLSINPGQAEGTMIGGNLSTLLLLSNTSFMPEADDIVLFIEDDEESQLHHFDRNLTALSQQPWFSNVRGVVVGRFQKASKASNDLIKQMIGQNSRLNNLPIIANADFGHTTPLMTIPIGGYAHISSEIEPFITITRH